MPATSTSVEPDIRIGVEMRGKRYVGTCRVNGRTLLTASKIDEATAIEAATDIGRRERAAILKRQESEALSA